MTLCYSDWVKAGANGCCTPIPDHPILRLGASAEDRHSHQSLCDLYDTSQEAGGPAGAGQLPQSLPAPLVPAPDEVHTLSTEVHRTVATSHL